MVEELVVTVPLFDNWTSFSPQDKANKRLSMGPLKMAAMNGLSISRASVLDPTPYENRAPKDERVSFNYCNN